MGKDARKRNQSPSQSIELQRARTTLLKRILKFVALRPVFQPGLDGYLTLLASSEAEEASRLGKTYKTVDFNALKSTPERIPLFLPSSIPAQNRSTVCGGGSLAMVEDALRFAAAEETLTALRGQLIKRSCAYTYKQKHSPSQRIFTQFRTLLAHTEAKIALLELRYNDHRSALVALRGAGDWEQTLRVLAPEDVRGMGEKALTEEERVELVHTRRIAGLSDKEIEGELEELVNVPVISFDPVLAVGDGFQSLSWIWYSTGKNSTDIGHIEDCMSLPLSSTQCGQLTFFRSASRVV